MNTLETRNAVTDQDWDRVDYNQNQSGTVEIDAVVTAQRDTRDSIWSFLVYFIIFIAMSRVSLAPPSHDALIQGVNHC